MRVSTMAKAITAHGLQRNKPKKEEKGISERKRGKKKKIKSKHSHLETAHSSWTMNFLGLLARASSAARLHLLAK